MEKQWVWSLNFYFKLFFYKEWKFVDIYQIVFENETFMTLLCLCVRNIKQDLPFSTYFEIWGTGIKITGFFNLSDLNQIISSIGKMAFIKL